MTFGKSTRSDPHSMLVAVGADGYVSAEDVIFLRRNVFPDGVVSRAELDAIFALAERALDGDPEWPMFFEETVADFYLREEEPHGYLTAHEFDTLKARITRDGEEASEIELRMLIKLLETAVETPPQLHGFIADALRASIISEERGYGIDEYEAELVRRFIFAKGGSGNLAVTRAEAELLFDLNDATAHLGAHPAWTDFFVKGVANHLMAHFGYHAPSHDEARRTQQFMSDHSANAGGFLKRMLAGGLNGFKEEEKSLAARRNEARERDAAAAEVVTPLEADWLADRIGRNGELHESERALIDHIRDLGAELPPALKTIVERAA